VKQLEKEKAIVEAAEKDKTVLQTRIAKLEKQATEEAVQQKVLEQLRDNLAQEKRVQTETEKKLTSTAELQEAAQKAKLRT